MKKLLLLAAVLLCGGSTFAQTMIEVPVSAPFHAMSENGKYMVTTITSGEIGIYNTETGEYQEYADPVMSYMLGIGNMVTNDGFVVGNVNEQAAILDIENKTWTPLGLKAGDENRYTQASCISQAGEYIVGYVSTGGGFCSTMNKPVMWTRGNDGTYGVYEELPYPEKDFSGAMPKYILPNCISEDGTVIAAQIVMQDNYCLPLVYRKAKDGTWTYEMYDKDLCEPGTVFPEFPDHYPEAPDSYDYLTAEGRAAYSQDSIEYADSVAAYRSGLSDTYPSYYPTHENYMTAENLAEYQDALAVYAADNTDFSEKLRAYRLFFMENVTPNFYSQNSVWLSPNGKYYATTKRDWSASGGAVMLTIGDELEKKDYDDDMYGYCVTNDGDLFVSDKTTAYVYPAGSSERVTLADWLRSKGETEAADWLSDKTTGIAICSGDGRVISGHCKATGGYYNWIIKLDDVPTGITDVETDADAPDARVKVYDLQGCFIKEAPAANATDGLAKGIYIINNKKVIVK